MEVLIFGEGQHLRVVDVVWGDEDSFDDLWRFFRGFVVREDDDDRMNVAFELQALSRSLAS